MITAFYAALLTLLYLALAVYIILGRYKHGAALEDGGVSDLRRRIRAHANMAEYLPLFLILLGLFEYSYPARSETVHVLGILFCIGRLSHAFSLLVHERYDNNGKLTHWPVFRTIGMVLTFVPVCFIAVRLLLSYTAS